LKHFKEVCKAEKKEVLDSGGLFILGTERHESRRIDNQLRGRAGRQGDPGAARFFLSLEDDLLRIFGADRISYVMEKLDMPEGEPIESNMVSKSIENAQRRVEGRNFDIRKNLLEYDDVMNQQRKTIYGMRDKVLAGDEPLYDMTLDVFDRAAVAMLNNFCPEKVRSDEWDIEGLTKEAQNRFGLDNDFTTIARRDQLGEELWSAIETKITSNVEDLQYIADKSNERFEDVEEYEPKTGHDIFLELIQNTYLKAIDFHWREHLKQMDALRDAIRFHGYAQKDPKKVYKIEGYECFERTMLSIDNQVVEYLTKIQVEREDQVQEIAPRAIRIRAVEAPTPLPAAPAKPAIAAAPTVAPAPIAAMPQAMAPPVEPKEAQGGNSPKPQSESNGVETVRRSIPKIGRNDPCPCGSGKKFKRCHMGKEDALAALL
ncbi:MAG: SEC-C metal-binding domain-containing protein, partial [Myxococcota bacterium]